jgi:tetratricopeptide (TPR) repeat protein
LKLRLTVAVLSVTFCAVLAGTAFARNPHIAGGIQYVTQGLNDKQRGNTEDYQREMNKAVDQLTLGTTEDPADFEGQGYLAWALAELDSAGPAGEWFSKAAAAAAAKGDKKKLDVIVSNRDHYWSIAFNDGIKNVQAAQQLSEAGVKDEAAKAFALAAEKLTAATLLRPGHPQTIRNLATAYALALDYDASERVLVAGISQAAGDTAAYVLTEALKTVRQNKAGALTDAKKYDEAIAYYIELTKAEPGNADLWMGLGNAYYNRATEKSDATKKQDFKAAADAYAKASELRPADETLAFNAALSYQNAGELPFAETQWKSFLKAKPNDADALSSLASVLADQKKFADAQLALEQALQLKPDEKIYYRQLAAVFSKQGNNPKTAELMFVYLAMANGKPRADIAGALKEARAGSAAANTATAMGAPDKVLDWTDNTAGALQTWLYTSKHLAFTFNTAGALIQKSDWNPKK